MPRLTEETRQARRDQILEAATTCFTRKGFSATSMADVIKESGMSSGSIYSHFKSKEEILQATINRNVEALEQAISAPPQQGEPLSPRQLLGFVVSKSLVYGRPITLVKLWAEIGTSETITAMIDETVSRIHTTLTDQLMDWAASAAPAGENIRDLAFHEADKVLTVLQGVAVRLTLGPSLDSADFLERMSTMLPD